MKIPRRKWIKWMVSLTILHAVLSLVAGLLMTSAGLGFPDDRNPPATWRQEIASAFGLKMAEVLFLPGNALCDLFPQIRHVPWSDWPLVLFSGFFYAVLLITLWSRLVGRWRKT